MSFKYSQKNKELRKFKKKRVSTKKNYLTFNYKYARKYARKYALRKQGFRKQGFRKQGFRKQGFRKQGLPKLGLPKQRRYVMRLLKKKLKSKRLRPTYTRRVGEYSNLITNKNKKNLKTNSFAEHFLDNLTNFIGKKYSIFVTLKHLKVKSLKDSYTNSDAQFIKDKFNLKLFKYKRSEFFEIAKRIVFISVRKKNSAQFLANFISSQLNRLKKQQYFFLKCIKSILKLVLENMLVSTKLRGIKIVVKGRLQKARRAKRRTFKLSIGKVSLQQMASNINHAKATSYTQSGTFGTEVWINYTSKNARHF